jgi:DNA-binding Lrp family transcriptional regulator
MVKAFVFVDTATGTATDVVAAVDAIESVTEAHVVAGDYDVVVELTADIVADLYPVVSGEIRPLDGVEATRTYIEIG